jgi:hypothetical protein
MTCPDCDILAEPAITRGGVSVCSGCGACYTETGHATYRDLEQLSEADVAALRSQRRRVVPHMKKSRG